MKRIFLMSLLLTIVGALHAQPYPFTVDGSVIYVATTGSVGVSTNAPTGLFMVGSGTMTITAAGSVGIGITNPAHALDIYGATPTVVLFSTPTSTIPSLQLSNAGGAAVFGVENINGNALIGAGGLPYALEIIAPNLGTARALQLGTNNTAQVTVSNGGFMGIGTNSPNSGLNVSSTINTAYDPTASYNSAQGNLNSIECTNFDTTNNSFCQLIFRVSANAGASSVRLVAVRTSAANADLAIVSRGGSNQYEIARFVGSSGSLGIGVTSPASPYLLDVSSAAHATSFITSSDARFKENIKPLENVLERLRGIHGVSFDWNARYKKMKRATVGRQIGMIAQEVEKEFPELVLKWDAPDPDKPSSKAARIYDYRGLDYNRFTAVLLEAIKEQQKEIEELKTQVRALQK